MYVAVRNRLAGGFAVIDADVEPRNGRVLQKAAAQSLLSNDLDADLAPEIEDQLLKDIGVLRGGRRLRLRL
jgi:hypothetical protein